MHIHKRPQSALHASMPSTNINLSKSIPGALQCHFNYYILMGGDHSPYPPLPAIPTILYSSTNYPRQTSVWVLQDMMLIILSSAYPSSQVQVNSKGYRVNQVQGNNSSGESEIMTFRQLLTVSGTTYKPFHHYADHYSKAAVHIIQSVTEKP